MSQGSKTPSQVLEWLESGKAFVWAQISALRASISDELALLHPIIAEYLQDTIDEIKDLQGTDGSDWTRGSVDSIGLGFEGLITYTPKDHYRKMVLRYERILADIRQCEEFEDYLRPKNFADIISSSELSYVDGHIVFLNVDVQQCDAFILSPNGNVAHVPLRDLTQNKADRLCALWWSGLEACNVRDRATMISPSRQCGGSVSFAHLLKLIWLWIVRPILEALNILNSDAPAKRNLTHITWCPTGPLARLPLHAAGIYGSSPESGHRVFDYIVSSYTPSLSALMPCYRRDAVRHSPHSILILTQPNTPGQSRLPGTLDECIRICATLPDHTHTVLEHKQATVEATTAILNQHPWVHFACHASQHLHDPTQSAFQLYDGPLTLSALMNKASDNAELAFLSACQTATGDENVPEEFAHLAAGMLSVGFKGVVATMWSIKDADAPVVVEAYYKDLVALRKASVGGKEGTGAAYALHEAVRCLREEVGEDRFERWIPSVHFGA